jgi:methyl-accepting chemotaxis protein
MAKNLKEVIGYVKKSQGNVIEKSLLAKMLLLIGLPVAIIFSITTVIVLKDVKQSVTQLTTNHLTAESQSVANQINNYFSKYSEIIRQMESNELIRQYLQKPLAEKTSIQGYKDVKQTTDNIYNTDPDNISSAWIADCESNTMVSNEKDALYQITLSERPWYKLAVEKKI